MSLPQVLSLVRQRLPILAWVLTAMTVALAVLAWGASSRWQVSLNNYQLFPLFGLVAFSVLWTQYVVWATTRLTRAGFKRLHWFFEVTPWLVLVALVLHPALLVYQLWLDGFGLPPGSYLRHFVPPSLGWVALLGTASWLIFMLYNFRRMFGQRPWWRWVIYAGDVAMLAVFYHGLRLGSQLQQGWFRAVWLAYGIILVLVLVYLRQKQLKQLFAKIRGRDHEDTGS